MRYFSQLLKKLTRKKEAIIFSPTFEVSLLVRDKICKHRTLTVTAIFKEFSACMEAINQRPPDTVFFEIDAEGFRELAHEILDDFPRIRLIAISIQPAPPPRILNMHTAGIEGYINLLSDTSHILHVYDHAIRGETASTHDDDRKITFLLQRPLPGQILDEYRRIAQAADTR